MDAPLLVAPPRAPASLFARCYVLALFTLLTTLQTLFWFTFSSASEPGVKAYYGWDDAVLDLLLAWGPVVGLAVQPFATALLARRAGIERAMRLSAALMLACCALRLLPSLLHADWRQRHQRLVLGAAHVAQILNAAAGPLLMSGPTTVSARWFAPAHRGLATAVAYCGGNVGSLATFGLGPLLIANDASKVPRLLAVELALAAAAALAACAYLPAAPLAAEAASDAPAAEARCTAAACAGMGRARRALLDAPLATLAIVAGAQAGVSSAWQGVLSQQLAPPTFPARTAGLVGIVNGGACLLGNLLGGRLADACRARLSGCLALAYVGAGVAYALYALSLPSVCAAAPLLPWHDEYSLLTWSGFCGVCQGVADPLALELAAALCHRREPSNGAASVPIAAVDAGATSALSAGLVVASWNAASLLLLLLAPSLAHGAQGVNAAVPVTYALCAACVLAIACTVHRRAPPATPAAGAKGAAGAPMPPRFARGAVPEWMAHLASEGYVILADCLTADECDTAKGLLWDWLEGLGSGIDRCNVATWTDAQWPGHASFGFLMSRGGGHSAAAWYVRSHANVVAAFEAIWRTPELLVSLDTPIVWRPWWRRPSSEVEGATWLPRASTRRCRQVSSRGRKPEKK